MADSAELTIRVADPDRDGAAFARIYAPAVLEGSTSFELVAPTAAEMGERARETLLRLPWLTAERDGEIVGYAYAGPHRAREAYQWSAEVSVYVDANVRRGGVATTLYSRLCDELRTLGYFNAYAGVTLPNDPSVGFHEAFGFRPIGIYRGVGFKLGRWCDVAWYHFELQPRDRAPEAPVRPFGRPDRR